MTQYDVHLECVLDLDTALDFPGNILQNSHTLKVVCIKAFRLSNSKRK